MELLSSQGISCILHSLNCWTEKSKLCGVQLWGFFCAATCNFKSFQSMKHYPTKELTRNSDTKKDFLKKAQNTPAHHHRTSLTLELVATSYPQSTQIRIHSIQITHEKVSVHARLLITHFTFLKKTQVLNSAQTMTKINQASSESERAARFSSADRNTEQAHQLPPDCMGSATALPQLCKDADKIQ